MHSENLIVLLHTAPDHNVEFRHGYRLCGRFLVFGFVAFPGIVDELVQPLMRVFARPAPHVFDRPSPHEFDTRDLIQAVTIDSEPTAPLTLIHDRVVPNT